MHELAETDDRPAANFFQMPGNQVGGAIPVAAAACFHQLHVTHVRPLQRLQKALNLALELVQERSQPRPVQALEQDGIELTVQRTPLAHVDISLLATRHVLQPGQLLVCERRHDKLYGSPDKQRTDFEDLCHFGR